MMCLYKCVKESIVIAPRVLGFNKYDKEALIHNFLRGYSSQNENTGVILYIITC